MVFKILDFNFQNPKKIKLGVPLRSSIQTPNSKLMKATQGSLLIKSKDGNCWKEFVWISKIHTIRYLVKVEKTQLLGMVFFYNVIERFTSVIILSVWRHEYAVEVSWQKKLQLTMPALNYRIGTTATSQRFFLWLELCFPGPVAGRCRLWGGYWWGGRRRCQGLPGLI